MKIGESKFSLPQTTGSPHPTLSSSSVPCCSRYVGFLSISDAYRINRVSGNLSGIRPGLKPSNYEVDFRLDSETFKASPETATSAKLIWRWLAVKPGCGRKTALADFIGESIVSAAGTLPRAAGRLVQVALNERPRQNFPLARREFAAKYEHVSRFCRHRRTIRFHDRSRRLRAPASRRRL
jgi:hypothetical protein